MPQLLHIVNSLFKIIFSIFYFYCYLVLFLFQDFLFRSACHYGILLIIQPCNLILVIGIKVRRIRITFHNFLNEDCMNWNYIELIMKWFHRILSQRFERKWIKYSLVIHIQMVIWYSTNILINYTFVCYM